ncbi:glycosyltransferase [Candidatus Woesearchaeota archaeon]|nr:glycosyltransferase [Candidatus Woesearchaeota archaeon]MCF7901778.1 glycosyltransferase [Candidatus Woesearchaeota archaeon]
MASYLQDYPGGAKNRDKKFIRAVNSFKNQTYENKELIIVSDGCQKTIELYNENFVDDENIGIIQLPKQVLYSGEMRNSALRIAKGDIITYLDSDDVIGKTHIETILKQFDTEKYDWVFYNDYLVTSPDFKRLHTRVVETRFGSIGTSAITHKNNKDLEWSSGYGHDWIFVMKLAGLGLRFTKLKQNPQYLVCHFSGHDF